MNSDIISLIILLLSFLGLAILVYRKIPVLVSLQINNESSVAQNLVSGIKNKIKGLPGLKSFSFEVFLQKILSQIRVMSLKTDHQTFSWLQKLREKNHKKHLENKDYWEKLKNSTNDFKK